MLNIFVYYTVVHLTDQNQISKTVDRIRRVMVCKIGFTNWNEKITLLCASMVVTYYIKLFRTEVDRHNGILMSLPLLVAETIIDKFSNDISFYQKDKYLIVHSSDINACEYVPVILKDKGLNDYDTNKSFREMNCRRKAKPWMVLQSSEIIEILDKVWLCKSRIFLVEYKDLVHGLRLGSLIKKRKKCKASTYWAGNP